MRWRATPRQFALGVLALLLLVLLGVWIERVSIARRFADAQLKARQIDARYEITGVGPRSQRVENVVIGDPRDPDLTARWAEIELGGGFSGISVRGIRARGVRIKGRLIDGTVSFGAVDRFLPAPTGEPFSLPDISVDLADTQLRLETPYGPAGIGIAGKGNIAGSFNGVIAARAPQLAMEGLRASDLRTVMTLRTRARRIGFAGPVSFARASSGDVALGSTSVQLDGETDERFAAPRGAFQLTTQIESLPYAKVRRAVAEGRFSGDGADAYRLSGRATLDGLAPNARTRDMLLASVPAASGTPVAPLAAQLRSAIAALDRGATGDTDFALSWGINGARTLRITPAIRTASGATLDGKGDGLGWDFRAGTLSGNDTLTLSGGGFPSTQIQLAATPQGLNGQAIVQPYAAGGARLALTPFAFAQSAGGVRLDTVATIDGPLGDGRVNGLRVPLAIRPGANPLSGCMKPSFQRLEISGLVLAPATLSTCIAGNEARIASPVLRGRLGGSPIGIAAQSARVGFSRGDFDIRSLAVRLGDAKQPTRLDAATFGGVFNRGGANGRFAGGSGRIGEVPLLMSDAAGRWVLSNGVLTVNGGLRVTDAESEPRFYPMVSDDFALRLADGRITANGTAREARSNVKVADIRIEHRLSSGTGQATIDVRDLAFDNRLQPEMLTPATLGVIANVRGTVNGTGIIRWTPDAVTSSGGFRTDSLDLAAAFGPVTGLKGEIQLSDLLNLEAGAPQTIRISSINPGIPVVDGELTYRLLPGRRAAIDGGRWPFAGGVLILEPTILNLGEEAERRLTFRVEGVDAAKFIAQMEFENIAATGTFDGTIPMIFDQNGGRIEGGELIARGSGTLSYIGEVSNENLGLMGTFAFDALKAMKYNRLTIGLNGPLDGDVVTKIGLQGVTQAPVGAPRKSLPIKVRGLDNFPLKFNITITAPFRRLFQMARTLQDPSLLIEQLQPGLERVGPATTLPSADKPVQTPERP